MEKPKGGRGRKPTNPYDRVGMIFGKLRITKYLRDEWWYSPATGVVIIHHLYECKCNCGSTIEADYTTLASGSVKDCGDLTVHNHGLARRGRRRVSTSQIRFLSKEDIPPIEDITLIYHAYSYGLPIYTRFGLDGANEDISERLADARRELTRQGLDLKTLRLPTAKERLMMREGRVSTRQREKLPENIAAIQRNGAGMRFGRLSIIAPDHAVKRYAAKNGYQTVPHLAARIVTIRYYRVRCDCGNELVVTANELVSHLRKSCGCATSWSDGALAYAQSHPGTYRDGSGNYRDPDGFMIMIRTKKGV